jgi:O-antigen ligase
MNVHAPRWPAVAAGVVLLLLPCCRLSALQDPAFTPPQLLLALAGVVFALLLLFRKEPVAAPVRMHPWFLLSVLQLAWMLLSLRDAWLASEGLLDVLRFGLYIGWTILLVTALRSVPDPFRLLRRTALFTVVLCLVPFLQQLIGELQTSDGLSLSYRLSSFFGNKNYYSGVLVLLLPFTLSAASAETGFWKPAGWIATLLVLGQLILLQSIAAWLSVLGMAGSLFLLSARGAGRMRSLRVAGIALGVGLLAILLISRYSDYNELLLRKLQSFGQQGSVTERLGEADLRNQSSLFEREMMFRNAWLQFRDHPLFGAGVSNWRMLQAQYGVGGTAHLNRGMVRFEHPHNEYVLFLAEQGIVGLLIWLASHVALVVPALRRMNDPAADPRQQLAARWSIAGLAGFAVLSLLAYPALRPMERMLFQLHAAVLIAVAPVAIGTPLSWKPGRGAGAMLVVFFVGALAVLWQRLGAELHFYQALVWQAKRQPERMIREVRKAYSYWFQVDYTTTPLIWYEGMSAFHRGEVPTALPYFQQAERVSPWHLRVLNDLGTCYERTGQLDSAVALYERGLRVTPHFVEGRLNLAAAWYNAGRPFQAAATLAPLDPASLRRAELDNYARYTGIILGSIARKELVAEPDTAHVRRWVEGYGSWSRLLRSTHGDSLRLKKALRNDWERESGQAAQ